MTSQLGKAAPGKTCIFIWEKLFMIGEKNNKSISNMKYAPLTTVEVEKSFSIDEAIFTDRGT